MSEHVMSGKYRILKVVLCLIVIREDDRILCKTHGYISNHLKALLGLTSSLCYCKCFGEASF